MNSLVFISVFFAISQNGFINMCQATGCNNYGGQIRYDPQQIIAMRVQATSLARILASNQELKISAATSSETIHRIAAAFSCGMSYNIDETVYMLATDADPLVFLAARESMVYVASRKYKKIGVDFGPYPNAEFSQKDDAVKLWRLFFEANDKRNIKPINIINPVMNIPEKKQLPPCEKCIPPKQFVEILHEKENLPKNKPNLMQVEIVDEETIPGFRIKRITTKPITNDY